MSDLFKTLSALRKDGKSDEALALLQATLRSGMHAPEELDRAGRFLAKDLASRNVSSAVHIHVLGQCTTTWLLPMLAATAWARGVRIAVSEGEFDNVVQDLASLAEAPDVLVLVPWTQRLLGVSDRLSEARLADELAFWEQAWSLAKARGIARLIQVGYDWIVPGAGGHHLGGSGGGDVALVRAANERLRAALPKGTYFVDLEQLSGILGRARFYDPRQYNWTKQPFSMSGLASLATQIFAGIRALTSGPKKVLVLDLDNTLWGGVVGETGPLGVALGESPDGEAFRAFQAHAKALAQRGVLLAVASKNNPEDAREPFEKHPDSVLAMSDFAAFEASWDPKAIALRRIAETLSLGLDSFVFFDDNPAEREHIRQALPEVEVVDVPEDPAEYVRALSDGMWFETIGLTEEDRARTAQYVVERQRTETKASYGSLDDYLASLEMTANTQPIGEPDMQRVVQLIGKTNQFNLTTRRHSEEQLRAILATVGSISIVMRMADRFGDYGLVAVVLGVPLPSAEVPSLLVDTWLMSCRVIGRTAEQFTLQQIAARAQALGYQRIVGEFIPTKKNALVARLYDELGFAMIATRPDGSSLHGFDLTPSPALPRTFIAAKDDLVPELAVDLGAPIFWGFLAVALALLVPIVDGRARRIALATLNLTFAALCVGRHELPVLLVLLAGIYVAARMAHAKATHRFALAIAGTAVLILFLVHKVPDIVFVGRVRPMLAAIGFSYVALRIVELLRAMAEQRHPAPDPFALVSYLIPFHMLAAGPIQAYDDFCTQPAVGDRLTVPFALGALDRIASGLFKKFVIAQALQAVFLTGFTARGPYLLVEAQIYYLWVYLDFSAYSDIAVGIGKLLGIATPENFANPLIARNLIDFWERWHISLSQFIRRNLFIPIQVALMRRSGGARGLLIASIAFSISFLLCGLWHGVSLRFLVWGGLHAAGLVVTNLYKHALQKRVGRKGVKAYMARRSVRAVSTVLTFEFVAFSLVFIAYPFAGGWL